MQDVNPLSSSSKFGTSAGFTADSFYTVKC